MSAAAERRVRLFRSRVQIRAWDYRQRHLSRGVWFRLRRVLAGAERAFVISDDEARILEAEGYPLADVGAQLAPPKVIVKVPLARAAQLASAREVPVALSAALLQASSLALVPFDEADG